MAKGCNIGNYVITNSTNTYPLVYQPTVELFNGETLIVYNNGMTLQAGKCYITDPYGPIDKQCIANGNHGNVITYTDAQVNCQPTVEVPLDSGIIYLFIAMLIFAVYSIKVYTKVKSVKYEK